MAFSQSYRLNQTSLPKFEFGGGLGWANLPYYPGSTIRRTLVLPVPSFIYRGDKLRADEDGGLRGRFFSNRHLEINTSFGLIFPVKSEKVPLRKGMKDLDPVIEIGPGVIIHLIPKKKNQKYTISLNLGTRVGIQTDFTSVHHRGYVFSPLLFSWIQASKKVTLFNGLALAWSTKKHQAYLYDVANHEAASFRPAYRSSGGLFNSRLVSFFIYNPHPNWSLFGGGIWQNYNLAANKKSPLHETDNAISGILGFTYWFYQSKTRVSY